MRALSDWAHLSQESLSTEQYTEVRFASFLSGAILVNPPERKLAERTSVQ